MVFLASKLMYRANKLCEACCYGDSVDVHVVLALPRSEVESTADEDNGGGGVCGDLVVYM